MFAHDAFRVLIKAEQENRVNEVFLKETICIYGSMIENSQARPTTYNARGDGSPGDMLQL